MNARIFSARLVPLAALAVTLLLGSLNNSANAQQRILAITSDKPETYIVPTIAPDREVPRLGFEARVVSNGLRIERVHYGTLAFDAGLERGDVIREINGRRIGSMMEYQQALLDAQDFRDGRVRLLVENIRWHMGDSCQRLVHRTIFLPHVCHDDDFGGGTFGG